MSKPDEITPTRRNFFLTASAAFAAVGVGAITVPLFDQMNPARGDRSPLRIEFDVSHVPVGEQIILQWRDLPVFVRRRTTHEIEEAQAVNWRSLRDPQADADRVHPDFPELLVVVGRCTRLGCVPLTEQGDYNGWFCPCGGSHFDTSGRIRRGPAPRNLEVPDWQFVGGSDYGAISLPV